MFCFYGEKRDFLFGLKLLFSCFAWEKLLFISEAAGLETPWPSREGSLHCHSPYTGMYFLGHGVFPMASLVCMGFGNKTFFCVCLWPAGRRFWFENGELFSLFLEFWFTLDTVSW